MIRGTTPTHTFTLPFDVSTIKSLVIVYAQNGTEVLKKEMDDCQMNGTDITVRLTQEDSLKFNANGSVQIQIKVLTTAGEALASYIQTVPVLECLIDEVLK